MKNLMQFKYDFANWNKIYSRGIVRQNELWFREEMKVGEDLLFNCCYYQYSSVVTIIDEALYNYRVHADSIMNRDEHDDVGEYNKLYSSFHQFCYERQKQSPIKTFDVEMRRGFYYAVIPRLVTRIKKSEKSGRGRVKRFTQLMQQTDKGLFNYTKEELGNGMQAIKKRMLRAGYFRSFSFLKFIKM